MWMRLVGRFAGWAGLLLVTAAIGRGDDPQDAGRASAPPSGAQAAGTAGQEVARPPLTSEGGSTLYRGAEAYQRASGARPRPKRTIKAHVVALDQPYMWNRLGASQPNAMVYALARDVVPADYDPKTGPPPAFNTYQPGKVRLREDKRPRPPGAAGQ